MAGTNDFKAFATDANANVTSQEEWETLTALKKGFSSGKASSAQVSKALRQPSTMAAVLGQFIANAELDALDDGDVDGLVAKLATAITTNLQLKEAAKLGVAKADQMAEGTATDLLPSVAAVMSLFSKRAFTGNNYIRIPDVAGGLLIQWGRTIFTSPDGNVGTLVTFPIAFPSACLSAVGSDWGETGNGSSCLSFALGNFTTTNMRCWARNPTASGAYTTASGYYIAIGY
ncbi:hypothetical protein POX55_14010 [Escherichia coli]